MKDISKPTPKSASPEEPVIYLEADEEITAATSRMLASTSKEVRIVVPKRSTLLQSVVNQKLLKRAAENAGKSLILVTADRTATHLAAQVGIPVAATVKAEAEIPDAGEAPKTDTSDIIENATEIAAVAAVAKVAATPKPAYATPMMKSQPKINNPFAPEADQLQDVAEPEVAATTFKPSFKPGKSPKAPKVKKNRKVPDFNELPKRVMIGVAAAVLIGLIAFAQFFFKQATVTLIAAGQLVDVNTNFKADTNADAVSITTATLPAKKYEITHDLSGSTATTGTKDAGTKATGTMTIKNKTGVAQTLVSGTRFSASGKVFKSLSDATVGGATVDGGGNVVPGSTSVSVEAETAGDSFNLAPTQYTIPALPADKQSKIYGVGSQMSGGTTKTIKVVAQVDVDKVTKDAIDKEKDEVTKQLNDKASASQMILPDSFAAVTSELVATPAVDAEGDQVSVKFKVTYSITTIKKTDLDTYVTAVVKKQVGADKQIYQSGVDNGKITAINGAYNFTSTASAGEKINTDELVQEIKGKRTGAATDIASKVPGVSRATISLSPAWSVKLPSIVDHIKIDIKVEQQSKP